jgi:hypothetical protein
MLRIDVLGPAMVLAVELFGYGSTPTDAAEGVSKTKPQIKMRPKTSKCADGFDCSGLMQWSTSQSTSKKSKASRKVKGGT